MFNKLIFSSTYPIILSVLFTAISSYILIPSSTNILKYLFSTFSAIASPSSEPICSKGVLFGDRAHEDTFLVLVKGVNTECVITSATKPINFKEEASSSISPNEFTLRTIPLQGQNIGKNLAVIRGIKQISTKENALNSNKHTLSVNGTNNMGYNPLDETNYKSDSVIVMSGWDFMYHSVHTPFSSYTLLFIAFLMVYSLFYMIFKALKQKT